MSGNETISFSTDSKHWESLPHFRLEDNSLATIDTLMESNKDMTKSSFGNLDGGPFHYLFIPSLKSIFVYQKLPVSLSHNDHKRIISVADSMMINDGSNSGVIRFAGFVDDGLRKNPVDSSLVTSLLDKIVEQGKLSHEDAELIDPKECYIINIHRSGITVFDYRGYFVREIRNKWNIN